MSFRNTSLVVLTAITALSGLTLLRCSSSDSAAAPPATEDGGPTDEDGGPTDEDGAVSTTCPATGAAKVLATVTDTAVTEASGIGSSTKNPGVFWLHNDSGDTARAFAVGSDGALLATVAFDTTKPTDIEDMAIDSEGSLYFGDIGDNGESRTSLTIHRVAEPTVAAGPAQTLTVTSEKMTVTYPDGAHNAETLLFDPIDKALVIVTKKAGGPSAFHRVGAFAPGGNAKTEKIGEHTIDLATGGEISRDGKYIVVRDYTKSAYLWVRADGESLADAVARPPCKIPVAAETQGEAFAFLADGTGYVTTTEGAKPPISVVLFK